MAKKKKDPSGGFVIIALQLLGAIILLVTFLAILALVGAWLYFEKTILKYQGVQGFEDFKLTHEDKKTLQNFTQAKTRIDFRLAEIYELRRNLPLKKDGGFDNRNTEGRELNSELQTLRRELEQCDITIDRLSSLQEDEYRRWVTIRSGLYSSRAAMIALPIIAMFFFAKTPSAVINLSAFIERTTGLPPVGNIHEFYGIFTTTAGVVSIMFLLTWGIGRWIALQSGND